MLLPLLLSSAWALDAGDLSVRPTGWVRPSFVYIQDDDAVVDDQDGFRLSARIGARAKWKDLLAARIEVELAPEPTLKDAAVVVRPLPWLDVELGQYKLPVSIAALSSDTRRVLPEPARVVEEVAGRDLGASVALSLPIAGKRRATFTSGVYNGEGANRIQNVNQRFLYVERLLVTPLGPRDGAWEGTDGKAYVGVGGGWMYNYQGADLTAEEINVYAAELQLAWGPVSAQGELLIGEHAFANPAVADFAWRGWYGQAATFIPVDPLDHVLEVAIRVGADDPDLDEEGTVSGPIPPASLELTGGLNAYVPVGDLPLHDVKLQAAWSHFIETEGESAADDRLAITATARF